jgi:hypothetical protein
MPRTYTLSPEGKAAKAVNAAKAAAVANAAPVLVRRLEARTDAEFTPDVLDRLRRLLLAKGGVSA